MSDRALASQIFSSITSTGAKAPKPVFDAWRDVQRVGEAARQLYPGPDAVGHAVAAALLDGRDPLADPQVQRIVTAGAIGVEGVAVVVDGVAYARLREVLVENADAVVAAWRVPFDQAAGTLAAAFDRIGPVALADAELWLKHGKDAAELWTQSRAASETVEAVRAGWVAFGDFTGLVRIDPVHRVLNAAEPTYEQWVNNNLRNAKVAPWELLCAGCRLSLPTPSEYHQRVRQITDAANTPEIVVDAGRSNIAGRQILVPTGRRGVAG